MRLHGAAEHRACCLLMVSRRSCSCWLCSALDEWIDSSRCWCCGVNRASSSTPASRTDAAVAVVTSRSSSVAAFCTTGPPAACWSFSVPARSPDHVGAFFRNPRCRTSASSFHERALVSRFPTTSGPRHPCGPCPHSQATRSQHLNSTSAPLCLGVSKNSPVRRPFLRFRFPPPKRLSA